MTADVARSTRTRLVGSWTQSDVPSAANQRGATGSPTWIRLSICAPAGNDADGDGAAPVDGAGDSMTLDFEGGRSAYRRPWSSWLPRSRRPPARSRGAKDSSASPHRLRRRSRPWRRRSPARPPTNIASNFSSVCAVRVNGRSSQEKVPSCPRDGPDAAVRGCKESTRSERWLDDQGGMVWARGAGPAEPTSSTRRAQASAESSLDSEDRHAADDRSRRTPIDDVRTLEPKLG